MASHAAASPLRTRPTSSVKSGRMAWSLGAVSMSIRRPVEKR